MPVQGKLAGAICGPFGCTVFHGTDVVVVLTLEEYQVLGKDLADYKAELEQAKAELGSVKDARKDTQDHRDIVQSELYAYKEKLKEVTEELQRKSSDHALVLCDLNFAHNQKTELHKERIALEEKLKEVEKELEIWKGNYQESQRELEHTKAQLKSAEAQVVQMAEKNKGIGAAAIEAAYNVTVSLSEAQPPESIKFANEANTKVLIENACTEHQLKPGDIVTFLVWHDITKPLPEGETYWKFRRNVTHVHPLSESDFVVTIDQALPTGYLVEIGEVRRA